MTMIDEKMSRLIAALVEKTESGKVTWNKTVSTNRYLANFSQYAVSMEHVPAEDEYNSDYYIFSLLNDDGEEIESISPSFKQSTEYRNLPKLFNLARRIANNVEQSIDSLLETLEQV